MSRVLIIGGGAAGMAAAIAAAGCGHEVHLYEKNEKLGKKLFITGKGRCNVTNACGVEELMGHVVTNPRFLYSSFYGFTNGDIMRLLEQNGCPLKVERGNRVFPVSDKSSDVIRALWGRMEELGVKVHLFREVEDVVTEDGTCLGIRVLQGGRHGGDHGNHAGPGGHGSGEGAYMEGGCRFVRGDAVIVATGGLSYESTGSTGDGYRFARENGHKVTQLLPALVPFYVKEPVVKELQGLSLRNIEAVIFDGGRELYREFGELLFTHFGVSGPVVLSASSFVAKVLKKKALTLSVDLKPALDAKQLHARVLRDFEEASNKQFKNALGRLYPAKLVPVMIARSGIPPEKKVREVTRAERQRLVEETKDFRLTLTGLGGFKEAIITQGGVAVKEIHPGTMESKLVKNLYFAGEVLDLDGVTGGFNLQIAWSTGWAAGSHVPWG